MYSNLYGYAQRVAERNLQLNKGYLGVTKKWALIGVIQIQGQLLGRPEPRTHNSMDMT